MLSAIHLNSAQPFITSIGDNLRKFAVIALCLISTALPQVCHGQTMEFSPADIILEVDARRLFTEKEWMQATFTHSKTPWDLYGREPFVQWLKGLQFINANGNGMPLGLELYDHIEKIVLEGHYYKGFEVRRIQQAAKSGKITRMQMIELLDKIDKGEKINFSGVDHSTLAGKFRWDPLDEFVHEGEFIDKLGNRYLTEEEIRAAQKNPLLKVDPKKIKKSDGLFYEGQIEYPRIKDLKKLTRNTLEIANQKLSQNPSQLDAVLIINEMYQRLITIHRSLDGNGRTLRLLRDLMFYRIGVPPPMHVTENDLFLTDEKVFFDKTVEQMHRYEKARKDYLKQTEPSRPSHLFYWSSPGTWKWMVENNPLPGFVPTQTIPRNAHITKGRSQLVDRAATFTWSNPIGAMRGGDFDDGRIELYAKPGPNGEAPNLLSMKISDEAKVLRLRTHWEVLLMINAKIDYSKYDLIYHEAVDLNGQVTYKEWIVLNPKVVVSYSTDPVVNSKLIQPYYNRLKNPFLKIENHEIHFTGTSPKTMLPVIKQYLETAPSVSANMCRDAVRNP